MRTVTQVVECCTAPKSEAPQFECPRVSDKQFAGVKRVEEWVGSGGNLELRWLRGTEPQAPCSQEFQIAKRS